MSTALALAAVTAVLRDLLNSGIIARNLTAAVGDVTVSALPPDRIPTTATEERSQLNLFLYQVTPNAAWRNVGLPSHDGRGQRLSHPPLALDLHYLLTAYGAQEFQAEILMGHAMQLLHETPVLTRDAIRVALTPPPPPPGGGASPILQALSTANLAEQVEQIKISPEFMNTEEISKLWAALQAHYRPTTSYVASVVLIESRRPSIAALPVRDRRIHARPFQQPVIESISPQIVAPGGQLTIRGHNLQGDITSVSFGTLPATPDTVTEQQIAVTLPPDLLAGINTVQVVHGLQLGTPSDPHRGFASNVVAFILAPTITTPPPITVAPGATLTLSVMPPVGQAQQVALLLGDRAISIPARPPTPVTTTSLDFPIPSSFPTGTFLMRLRVDGAESPLIVDTNQASATFNQYIGPNVTVI
jgi:hypothetical protein